MTFGMPTLLEHSDIEQDIRLCCELGLSFIEINMNMPQYQLPFLQKGGRVHRLLKESGLFCTLHLDEKLDPFVFNPLVRDAWQQTALDAVRAAAGLDCPIVNMHLQPGIYFTLPDRREFLYSTFRDDYLHTAESFGRLLSPELERSGIMLCIENTDGFTDFHREAIDILLGFGCFGLTWDIGHSHCANEADREFILERRKFLRHMHIHDASGSKCHLPLGGGELNVPEYISLAEECGCRCVAEVKTAAALSDSAALLHI